MTTRQLLRRLVSEVAAAISQGDSAPLENEAVRIVRLLLRRYRLPQLLERAVLQEAVREAQPLLDRFSNADDQRLFGIIAARASADVATVAGKVETSIVRELRSAYARSGGPSTADLQRALRPIERGTRARASTIANTATAAYDRAARLADAEVAGAERFKYAGPPADRLFCLLRLKEAREGMTFTLDQIRQMTNGQGLPVDLYCGGYNCRHQWLPVFDVPTPAPRKPAPEPEPEPVRANLRGDDFEPNGTAVSAALDGPSRGDLRKWLGRTTNAIDGVHGDGVLPQVPIERGTSSDRYGALEFHRGKDAAKRITLDIPDHPEMTLAHEIGHFLDLHGIPGAGDMGFASNDAGSVLNGWFAAVEQTKEYRELQRLVSESQSAREKVVYGYYLKRHELWARSYAQYVAMRSGDEAMLEQLNNLRKGVYSFKQWSDDEFKPVAAAIDNVFESLGWIRKK